MELVPEASRPDAYTVFETDTGERLIVLAGLDANQPVELYPLQQWLATQVPFLSVLYWLIVLAVAVYLVGMHIVLPLVHRFK